MSFWKVRVVGSLPRIAVMAHDMVMVWLSWQLIHVARFSLMKDAPSIPWLSSDVLIVLAVQALVFHQVGLYKGLWRYASTADLLNIVKACLIGVAGITLALTYKRLEGVPLSVLGLYPVALAVLLGGPRLLYRAWKDQGAIHTDASACRVLVLGAGFAGKSLVKSMLRSDDYDPVGFLDDSPYLRGAKLQGVPILGKLDEVAVIAKDTAAKLLVIAIPTLDAKGMQRVAELCESTGLPFRRMPRLGDMLEGTSVPGQLREVDIEDLLGREPVQPDWGLIRAWLRGRIVMVTGAGGSIGSELCRQCARHGAVRVVLLEISEMLLLNTCNELRRGFPNLQVECVLGDCGDPAVVRHALSGHCPDTVFHAAAYKQVPLLEDQVREAVRNNTLATECVARASQEHGVENFVLISTDKAVDPINALGATKRYAEMICQSLNQKKSRTRFVTVRFGNVLGSVGSVVPLFREQIRKGGPVTVTDPEVSRYFMTIPEACLLILQAAASSSHGAIYMLDMGKPVLIRVLAEQMIRLAGKRPGEDIAITYTGLRPGEKLHESLLYSDENSRPTSHPKVLEAEMRPLRAEQVLGSLAGLREAVADYDLKAISKIISAIIPEYSPLPDENDRVMKTNIIQLHLPPPPPPMKTGEN